MPIGGHDGAAHNLNKMPIIWNSERVSKGMAETLAVRPAIMAAFRDMLIDYGKYVGDERQLDLLAGNWIDQLLHVTYAAHEEALICQSEERAAPQRVASDLKAYVQFTVTLAFHAELRATIGNLLRGDGTSARRVALGQVRVHGAGAGLKKRIATGMLGSSRPEVLFCSPYPKCSLATWTSALWDWRRWSRWDDLDMPLELDIQIDADWRRTRSIEAGPVTSFESLLRVLLPLHVPAALLEGLADFRAMVFKPKRNRPRVLYTANALHGQLPFKLLAAEWRDQGTKLVCHQHGSAYGLDRYHPLEDYESRVTDRFYSWGWRRPDRQVLPLSPAYPRLHRNPSPGILLVCCSFAPTVYRLHFHPMPGTLELVESNTEDFLKMLPGGARLMIRLNPAYNGNGASIRAKLQSFAPHAAMDDLRESIFRRYEQYSLIVHNNIGTAVLESLGYNIPTVAFYDDSTYAFRAEAQPLIDALERVGILHRSGLGAAAFVAGLGLDVAGWWHGEEVQDARRQFASQYANLSPNWRSDWEAELRGLAVSA